MRQPWLFFLALLLARITRQLASLLVYWQKLRHPTSRRVFVGGDSLNGLGSPYKFLGPEVSPAIALFFLGKSTVLHTYKVIRLASHSVASNNNSRLPVLPSTISFLRYLRHLQTVWLMRVEYASLRAQRTSWGSRLPVYFLSLQLAPSVSLYHPSHTRIRICIRTTLFFEPLLRAWSWPLGTPSSTCAFKSPEGHAIDNHAHSM